MIPHIPDENICDRITNRIKAFWNIYKYCLIIFMVFIIIGSVAISIILTQKTYSYPCIVYSAEALASTITVDCIQYTWNVMCPNRPYTFPADYNGFWRRSPQGTTRVICRSDPNACGIGSYGNLIVYMQFCQI